MWPLLTYSNCFEIVSTMAFLVLQKRLILGMFVFNTVILYYTYIIIQGIIFAVRGFWILEYQLVSLASSYSYIPVQVVITQV